MKLLLPFWLLLWALAAAGQAPARPATPPPADESLEFVANRGQWPATVRYGAAVPGGHLYLEPGGLRYVLLQALPHPHATAGLAARASNENPGDEADDLVRGHQLHVSFVGAQEAALQPDRATGGVRHYLHGDDPTRWAREVPGYRQVRYQQPWPGIDMRFYENAAHRLEYDLELAAGADPTRVQLRYEGATSLRLSAEGQLRIGTTVGGLTELRPQAYQLDAASGERRAVACAYQLAGEVVRFQLGPYDHARPLIIDPTVVFSTYSGAQGSNWGFTATYDAAGNIYSGGIVLDDGNALPSFPTTPGAFQTRFGNLIDIALIKYDPAASGPAARVWATYLGGNRADFPSSLVVNEQNELLVVGSSSSTNYPTTRGAVQRRFAGGTRVLPFGGGGVYAVPEGTDIVVTRLAANGSSLVASTYLGGSANDGIAAYEPTSAARQLPQNYGDPLRADVQTDQQGNVYVASVTASSNFPTTAGSFGPAYRGGPSDAVVCKLNATMTALTWSGLLGGSAADAAYSLQLDGGGNVYVSGGTLSANLPGTTGGYQATARGSVDGFVARIAANGAAVQRATYLGTSAYDQAFFVQLGSDGGVYVLGQSLGQWPVSGGVYRNAGSHQFIQKLSHELTTSLQSTVFGSGRRTLDISPTAFLVDQCDRVYACGWGGMVNQFVYADTALSHLNGYTHGLPTTPNAVRTTPDTPGAGSDFYLAQFAPGLGSLVYGTYYGDATPNSEGDHVDGGTSRFDPRGVVYAAVCSCFNQNGFPVPPGANTYSAVNGSNYLCNNAAFKMNFEPTVAVVGNARTVCTSSPALALVGAPMGGTWAGPGVSGSLAAGYIFTPSPALVGANTLTYTVPGVSSLCTTSAQLTITVEAAGPVAATAPPPVCANAGPVPLTGGTPFGGTWAGPGVSGSVAAGFVFTPSRALVGPQRLTYTLPTSVACSAAASTASITLMVLAAPLVAVAADTVLCPGSQQGFQLRGSPAGGVWAGPGVSGGNFFTPGTLLGTVSLTYTVDDGGGCPVVATRRITLLPSTYYQAFYARQPCPTFRFDSTATAPYTVGFFYPLHAARAGVPTQVALRWDFGDGSPAATDTLVRHTYAQAGTYQPRLLITLGTATCATTLTLPPIVVEPAFIPNIITPNSPTRNARFSPRLGGCPPRLQLFSRWGQPLLDDPAYQGTWGAEGVAAGIYYYLLTPSDGAAKVKGWVEVVR